MIMFRSIRTPLVISLLSILVLSNGLIAYFSLNQSSKSLRASAEGGLASTLEEKNKVIQSRIETEVAFLEELSSELVLDADISWDKKVSYIERRSDSRGYLAIARIEKDGVITRYDLEKSKGNAIGRPYFEKAMAGEAAVSDIIVSSVTGELIIVIAVPIKRDDKVVGVLNGVRSQTGLNGIIEDFNYGKTGLAFLINEEGYIMAHPDRSHVYNQVNFFDSVEKWSIENVENIKTKIHENETIITEVTNAHGVKEILIMSPMENTNFIVVGSISLDEVLSDMVNLRQVIIGFIVSVLFFSMIFSYILLRRMTNPLKELTNRIEWMTQNHLDQKMPVIYTHKKNEIGRLSVSFEVMREKVQESFIAIQKNNNELEVKVSERTKALSESLDALKKAQDQIVESQKHMTIAMMTRWLAHHLNTPLGNIVTLHSLLSENLKNLESSVDKTAFQSLDLIEKNTQRSVRIIQSLQRITQANEYMHLETVELNRFIKQNLNFFRDSYEDIENKIEIFSSKEIYIKVNPLALSQVLSILIDNIYEHAYTSENDILGKIFLECEHEKVRICINDFGKGLSKEQQDVLLKPFFENFTGHYQSGLGLQIAMNLLKSQLDGELHYVALEKGSSFVIEIPHNPLDLKKQ